MPLILSRRHLLQLAGMTLPCMALAEAPSAPTNLGQRLDAIGSRYFEDSLRLSPLMGSELMGGERFEDKLEIEIAPAHQRQQKALQRRLLRELASLPQAQLDAQQTLSLQVLRQQAQQRLEEQAFPAALLPIDHYGGMPVTLAQMASGQGTQALNTPRQYRHFLQRLARLPAWNAQAMVNMREGMRSGVVQSRALIEQALLTLQPLASAPLDQHPYAQPLRQFPASFSAAERADLSRRYEREIRSRLLPSMQSLLRFLREDYLPRTRASAGLGGLPNGAAWYAQRIRAATSTRMDAQSIHALGLREVARIRAEMGKIHAGFGGKGSLTEFLREQPMRPEYRPFKSDQEVLDAYARINAQVLAALPRLFHRGPKAALEIRAEPEISKATASAHYMSPAVDGSRPGVFFEVIMDPREISTSGMTSLFLHEGQPGHHFQIALQQELPLPDYRRYSSNEAYVEGWALYAETLGYEMGLYEDPMVRLGHLSADLHRAVRLVTDTGLHALGWTREQSMQYMQETEGLDAAEARRATERYMAWPAQALAYKIGQLKILELRERARKRLGERFSYADFHALVLEDGALPLDLLEAKIDSWLQARAPA
ncbi:DUF885 domain-containing protein [Paucibacter sp. KBW04]|uniref:DUF885 domain-containing protein n=1 Tax=Paucibacter sp. KBW04 TaxID=2153361 RepID=UPI000F55C12A|nr:DUF885 domain-containing protein [Paucibacter sp. KBW04]RQO61109.1 DUF885 domain-containing protein [Paucibacter sp. KBW04]